MGKWFGMKEGIVSPPKGKPPEGIGLSQSFGIGEGTRVG